MMIWLNGGPKTAGFDLYRCGTTLLVLEKKGIELPIETGLDAYIAVLGDEVNEAALSLVQAPSNPLYRTWTAQGNKFKSADAPCASFLDFWK